MSVSTSRRAYRDCFDILEKALEDPIGTRIKFTTYGLANYFRMRLHQARQIDRKENRATYADPEHPLHGASIYDMLTAKIRETTDGWWVYVEKRSSDRLIVESLSEIGETADEPSKVSISIPMAEAGVVEIDSIKRRA